MKTRSSASSRKQQQPRGGLSVSTTPPKRRKSAAVASVRWATSPTRVPLAMAEAGTSEVRGEEVFTFLLGGDEEGEMKLVDGSEATTSNTAATALMPSEEQVDFLDEEEDEHSREPQVSVFGLWASKGSDAQGEAETPGEPRATGNNDEKVKESGSGGTLMSAVCRLASDIRHIVDVSSQMSQGPAPLAASQQTGTPPPLAAPSTTPDPGVLRSTSAMNGAASCNMKSPSKGGHLHASLVPDDQDNQENKPVGSQKSYALAAPSSSGNDDEGCLRTKGLGADGVHADQQQQGRMQSVMNTRADVSASTTTVSFEMGNDVSMDQAELDAIAVLETKYWESKKACTSSVVEANATLSGTAAKPQGPDGETAPVMSDADLFLAAACSMVETSFLQSQTAGKLPGQSASCSPPGKHFAKFKVVGVVEAATEAEGPIKVLRAASRKLQREVRIELRGRWAETPVCANDTINVVWTSSDHRPLVDSPTSQTGTTVIVVDDAKNFVIVRPDVLVCPTRVADANSCLRRAVLSERLAIESPSRDTVLGHMKHSLFQSALQAGRFDEEFIHKLIPLVVRTPRAVEDLFRLGLSEDDASAELARNVKPFSQWGERMFGSRSEGEVLEFGHGNRRRARVLRIVATEEMIWSPMWGLKGALDVTAVVGLSAAHGGPEERVVLPLELKTGRQGPEKAEHRAQVMLYSLMIADRYLESTVPRREAGILIRAPSTGDEHDFDDVGTSLPLITTGVRAVHHELRELIAIRNRIAVNTTTAVPRSIMAATNRMVLNAAGMGMDNDDGVSAMGAARGGGSGGEEFNVVLGGSVDDERERLPGVTHNVNGECTRCFQRDTCTLVHIAVESGSQSSMNLTQEDHEKALGALSEAHLSYFARWNRILECEGRRNVSNQKHVWTRAPMDRERGARTCISNLLARIVPEVAETLNSVFAPSPSAMVEENKVFRDPSSVVDPTALSTSLVELFRGDGEEPIPVSDTHIAVGDLVLLNVEDSHLYIAKGHVVAMLPDKVVVRAQNFPSPEALQGLLATTGSGKRWCIDKVEILWGNRFLQGTLASMFVQIRSRSAASQSSQTKPLASSSTTMTSMGQPRRARRDREHDLVSQQQNAHKERMRALLVDLRPPRFIDPNDPGRRFIRDCDRNLLQSLLLNCDSVATVRRGLVMKKIPPRPSTSTAASNNDEARRSLSTAGRSSLDLAALTADQYAAVAATLAAEDYLCIIGAPGAGKTTTIAFVVHMLQTLGKSVLVSSFTHTACDNLLMKIRARGVEVLRVGSRSNVRRELHDAMLSEDSATVSELERHLENPRLVCGATCLGVKHALLQRKVFDYCILDEAGQLAEPYALGPLARAKCFIFVGDQKQLPPLVVSAEAKALGMDRSLFERLMDVHAKTAVVALTTQFRMNQEINDLANELFYSGTLQCGSPTIANQRLQLPFLERCFRRVDTTSWLFRSVDPNCPVVFIDTDGLGPHVARESRQPRHSTVNIGKSNDRVSSLASARAMDEDDGEDEEESTIVNQTEALLVHLVVDRLMRSGLPLRNIGVISPYRSQLRALRARLVETVEVDTVDKYQGRDKECIIVSMVRSNPGKVVGTLLSDWRRLNVAFTRAKSKLVVVGSGETLGSMLAARFVDVMKRRNWVVQLKPDDHKLFSDPGLRSGPTAKRAIAGLTS